MLRSYGLILHRNCPLTHVNYQASGGPYGYCRWAPKSMENMFKLNFFQFIFVSTYHVTGGGDLAKPNSNNSSTFKKQPVKVSNQHRFFLFGRNKTVNKA